VGTGVGEQLKGSATAGWLAVATVSAGGGHGVTLEGARRARQAAGQIEAPAVMRRPGLWQRFGLRCRTRPTPKCVRPVRKV
jgi:hypothetical protein